jgi:hypothetical protein
MLILLLACWGPLQGTDDYFPLTPGMKWEFENADGKTETKTVREARKIGDREYRLVQNALVGTPPERDIPALVSKDGVILFDEHDQVDVCWLKLPARPGAEWTYTSRVGSIKLKMGSEEQIEVPAGKFKALKVIADLDVQGSRGTMTIWYAKGIGEVRSDLVLKIHDEEKTWSRRLKKVETPPGR